MVQPMASSRVDLDAARRLMLHELEVQVTAGRELRDLGDGWLLHDPVDPEPYWNRLVGPAWPGDEGRFARRLDEVITLFASLDRIAHIRPLPIGNEPPDLAARLLANGFEQLAADVRMVLVDRAPSERLAAAFSTGRATAGRWAIARFPDGAGRPAGGALGRGPWASEASLVLMEAFGVDPLRRPLLEGDLLASVLRAGCSILVLYDDGEPVATARRTTVGGATYLSSIGTRPTWRGRGLGALVTALAVVDADSDPRHLVHLVVDVSNVGGRRLYERLGFVTVGEPVPDLLAL